MKLRRRRIVQVPRVESLEARIVLGFVSSDPIDEQPLGGPPTCGCQKNPAIVWTNNSTSAATTTAPIRDFDGTPVFFTDDLTASASPFANWGHTRSWSGLNNSSLNGNGWTISETPYLVVAGGTNGAPIPGAPPGGGAPGTEADDRITLVSGGTTTFTFAVPTSGPYTTYVPWGDQHVKLELTADPTPALRFTDAQGNVTEFYDVRRNGSGKPVAGSMATDLPQKYGKFKSYTAANGTTRVVAAYDSSGYLTTLTFSDSVTGDAGRIAYAYASVTNDLVAAASGTPATLLASVTLQRPNGSGGWNPVQRANYTYYTGRISNGLGGWQNDPNGRLGDLQLAQVQNAIGSGGSPTWQTVDTKYYRYYKFTGESNFVSSAGPTNVAATTGGPSPIQPSYGVYNPASPGDFDYLTFSGLKTVVEGADFDRMVAAVPGYLTASDATLMPYINHFFKYERWGDHVGADGNPIEFGSDYWNSNDSYPWRIRYRQGTRYRVIEEVAQGEGCSSCTGGQGTFKYEYAANYNTAGMGFYSIEYNTWRMKTTEYLPGGSSTWGDHDRQVTYTNEVGQPLLSVFVDVDGPSKPISSIPSSSNSGDNIVFTITATGHSFNTGDRVAISGILPQLFNGVYTITRIDANNFTIKVPKNYFDIESYFMDPTYPYINQTVNGVTIATTATKVVGEQATYYRYDDEGRLILQANPSAISGWDDAYLDLLQNTAGNYAYLRDGAGLIQTYSYYTSTTATGSVAGGVDGLLRASFVQQGETGTPIIQNLATYYTHTAGTATVYRIATDTVYGLDSGSAVDFSDRNPRTTTYSYTWYAGTNREQSVTVTKPIIAAAQNGPGTADTSTTFFDTHGRPTWIKDGDGFIHHQQYDPQTGAISKRIADVNTALTGTFVGLPSGWSTPSAGGLHLTTSTQVDGLGRVVKATDPNGNVTWTVYNDANHETRVYRGWNSTSHTATGPIEVIREYRPASGAPSGQRTVYYEALTSSASPTYNATTHAPTGQETIDASNIQSLRRDITNDGGQVVATDLYFSLGGILYSTALARLGSASNDSTTGNYHETEYRYDHRGRRNRILSPTGTISRTVYDDLGRVVSEWIGTDDTGATEKNPAGTGTPNNMAKVADYQYDGGGMGDNNLTKVTEYPNATASDARVTGYAYDWRNRPVATKSGVEGTEDTFTDRALIFTTYNNLSQVTSVSTYDGDGVALAATAPSASLLRAYAELRYDDQGRVFRTLRYNVNQSTGIKSTNALATDAWYDRRGNAIKLDEPGGLVTKTRYDGAGRTFKVYKTDGGGDSAWSDAATVTGDTVLTQSETTYDANGNAILVTTKDRFHDNLATDTGELGNATTGPKARVSYQTAYYDAANRPTAVVDVGTNGGTAYTRPGTVPSRSDTVLVTGYAYDAAGRLQTVTDPRAIATRTSYDALGRVIKAVEAYTDGIPTDTSNKTVEFAYDGNSHTLSLKVVLPGGGQQMTQYLYGVTAAEGNDVTSNELLRQVRHPDKSTGAPSATEAETYTYNALGDVKTAADRNGNAHTYGYNVLGQQIFDSITTLGTGVDGAVRRISMGYDVGGRVDNVSTWTAASGGNPITTVSRSYDGLGQLTWEEVYKQIDTDPRTFTNQYAYSNMSTGNHSRLIRRTTTSNFSGSLWMEFYGYNAGLDDSISRLSYLMDDNFANVEEYSYLGLDTVVARAHPQNGVDLTYIKRVGESNGDAGDQYTGLDRFGRVVDQRWLKSSTGVATDRFQYGYDPNGNRLFKSNLLEATQSELYHANGASNGYDLLDQMTGFAKGTLSDTNADGIPDTVASPSRTQSWNFDPLGNWESLTTNGSAQSRVHNKQNQVTTVGASSLTYDANGNMTRDETGRTFEYDAWNRLVRVKNSGGSTLVSYGYDGLGRRDTTTDSTGQMRLLFHDGWQVIEEDIRTAPDTFSVDAKNIWSPVYIDAMVLRDRKLSGGGTERLYVQQDANWNVTALVDTTGAVVERYGYDPYGEASVMAPNWTARASSSYGWVHLHQGGRYDSASGLYHFRRRDYSAKLGRWTSQDPISFAAGDTNLYRHVSNNPARFTDPSGLSPIIIWIFGIAFTETEVAFGAGIIGISGISAWIGFNSGFENVNGFGWGGSSGGGGAIGGGESVCDDGWGSSSGPATWNDEYDDGWSSSGEATWNNEYDDGWAGTGGTWDDGGAGLGAPLGPGFILPPGWLVDPIIHFGPEYIPKDEMGNPLPLPKTGGGRPEPSSPYPHTQIGSRGSGDRRYPQTREWGDDGCPVKIIDWTDHGNPKIHPNPHVHDEYINPTDGSIRRGGHRPPRPGEIPDFRW